MGRIFGVIGYDYPSGDAGGGYFHALAVALKSVGYDVEICSLGKDQEAVKKDPFSQRSYRSKSENAFGRLFSRVLLPYRAIKRMKECDDTQCVICNEPFAIGGFLALYRYCKKRKIDLIFCVVEWYSKDEFSSILNWNYIKNQLFNKWIIPASGVKTIAISSYLEKYFSEKENLSACVPSVKDIKAITVNKSLCEDSVKIIYAGSPGKKDYLNNIIDACALLGAETRKRIQLVVLGVDSKQLCDICEIPKEDLSKVSDVVKACGRVPREQVYKEYETSDFSILIRSQTHRYAKAGFPTKFTESLATGTPVICNLTSDLDQYCRDGENSIVVKDETPEAIKEAIERAAVLTLQQREKMSISARETAEQKLDCRMFSERIKQLIEKKNQE